MKQTIIVKNIKQNSILLYIFSSETMNNKIEIRVNDINTIIKQIRKSNWYPDIIISPIREIGIKISQHYNKPLFVFTWDHKIKDYYVLQQIIDKNTNKNILVVNDVNISGKTLLEIEKVINMYIELGKNTKGDKVSNKVKYAVILNKENSKFKNTSYVANVISCKIENEREQEQEQEQEQ